MDLISQVANLNHLAKVFSHYQQRHRSRSQSGRLRPGSDGETLVQFADRLDRNLRLISDSLLAGRYSFSPFVERRINLTGGPARTVSTATVRDSIVQKALALIVEPELDSVLVENCYSFRLGEEAPTVHDAITSVVRYHGAGQYWVVKEDISAYFDNLDHGLLLARLEEALPSDLPIVSLYRSYVQAPRLIDGEIVPRQRGVPLGTILANCLSNLYLTPLDRLMREQGHVYLRYCDDLIVFADSQSQAQQARAVIADVVGRLGLTLNSRKSSLLPPSGRFVHLGYEFDGERVRIGPRALSKFKGRIRGVTYRKSAGKLNSGGFHTDAGRTVLREIIAQVNNEICGNTPRNWARYFARCDFDDQFRQLDFWIRDRVRAAATNRWNKGNYRAIPTPLLQELGLRSLVGEYYTWRNRWRRRDRSLIQAIARLDRLRDVLESYRQRYYKPRHGTYDFRPGADGVTLEHFVANETSNLRHIQELLLNGRYQFTPFVEYTRAKRARSDERVICRASLTDTMVQKAIAQVVDQKFDHVLSEHCYSYRRGRSQFGAIGQVLARVNARADWWVVRSDFNSFLDTVNLSILASQLEGLLVDEPLLLDLYLKYLYNGRLRDGKFLPRTSGLPRGGILTPFLANLYLTPLDEAMAGEGFHYTRYADDTIVLAETEGRARQALERLDQLSGKLDLIQSPEKRKIFAPGEGFEFLGYQIKGSEVSIRPYAINSLKSRIRRVTDKRKYPQLDVKALSTEEGRAALQLLISRVNRTYIYRGGSDWARHFCRCSSDQQFRELDSWIADRIRMAVTKRWAAKNHRFISYRLLRELGWQPMVPLYWRWRREVWKQGASSS
jgi:RNA-directed DNA polymerase